MSAEADLVMSRHLDAPPDRVWRAWTECDDLRRWWGPKGYTATYCRIDLRAGGSFLVCVRSPDGKDIWSTGTYQEILPGRRIVSTDSFADEKGRVVSPTRYGFASDFPEELLLIATFEERDGGHGSRDPAPGHPSGEDYGSTRVGWSQSFDKLAQLLEPVGAARGR